MNVRKIFCVILAFLLIFTSITLSASANGAEVAEIKADAALTDKKIKTRSAVSDSIEISCTAPPDYIYVTFWDVPVDLTISGANEAEHFSGSFLHRLIKLPDVIKDTSLTLTFKATANVSEIEVIFGDTLPEHVQNWEDNNTLADLLLFSTHADDDQLFFAGVLPLYATNESCETQVVYFADHNENLIRRHELLNGLWAVGVTRYPVISPFPDAYSTSYSGALSNLEKSGFSENDALAFQVEQIRKFKPLVILGHDLKGEYGHGQHILNATLLTRAVESAAVESEFADSKDKYGTHDTPKLYLHLYEENPVVLDLDTIIEGIGKTPFELSKIGYACHETQQGYWFTRWLNGNNGEITKAKQIEKYSPCKFGLYRTTVGADVLKTDLFENVTMRSLVPPPEPEPEPIPDTEPTPDISTDPIDHKALLIGALVMIIIISLAVVKHFKKKEK